MTKRPAAGFAIGGLSGGEDKDKFWRVVHACTDVLPVDKPRYCMGVGCGHAHWCKRAVVPLRCGSFDPSCVTSACATVLRWTWSSVSRWALTCLTASFRLARLYVHRVAAVCPA